MGQESKGDFFNFIEATNKKGGESLRNAITKELCKADVSAEKIQAFFHTQHYDDISLDDCAKIVTIVKGGRRPWTPWEEDPQKY